MALENDSFKLRIFCFYGLQRAELKPQKKAVVFCTEYILFNTLQMSFGQSNDNLKLVFLFLNSCCKEAFVTPFFFHSIYKPKNGIIFHYCRILFLSCFLFTHQ